MDWQDYRRLTESPRYFSRWALESSLEIAHESGATCLAARIREQLGGEILEKPADHKGDQRTDFVSVNLTPEEVSALLDLLDGTSGSLRSGLQKHLAAVWLEYLNLLWAGDESRPV